MDYYFAAGKASEEITGHPGLEFLQNQIQPGQRILDVGCGEGTRLNTLLPKGGSGYGIDINPKAISMAKKKYPHHHFQIGSAEKLPFKSNSFDIVYSAFAIEHCQNPEMFIKEMIRVLKPGGRLVILAPNYGSPNRRSPVSLTDPLSKLIRGFIKDIWPHSVLDWDQVTPKDDYLKPDDDTTFEPYLHSAKRFLQKQGLNIEISSSLWELEPKPQKLHHHLFLFLGRMGLVPFRYWGPQLFVSALK